MLFRSDRQVELSNRLGMRFIQYRATLDGATVSDNALADVLRTSDDSAHRRRAWEASKQIGAEVEHDLLALVRLRNEGARSLGFDKDIGSLVPGKLADLVVLDRDYMTVPLDDILNIKPVMTMTGGKIVYEAK